MWLLRKHLLKKNWDQSTEDRIVSLNQPHIRPIIRGKGFLGLFLAIFQNNIFFQDFY